MRGFERRCGRLGKWWRKPELDQADRAPGASWKKAPTFSSQVEGDQSIDLWTRSHETDLTSGTRERRDLRILAHLRDHVSVHQAQAVLTSGPAGLHDVNVTPFTGTPPAQHGAWIGARTPASDFSAGAVFFIACINVASFLLGRALRRSPETSLRVALGASRAELLRELLSDRVVLSVAGGALGLLLAMITAPLLPALMFEGYAERLRFAPRLLPILMAVAGLHRHYGFVRNVAGGGNRDRPPLDGSSAGNGFAVKDDRTFAIGLGGCANHRVLHAGPGHRASRRGSPRGV